MKENFIKKLKKPIIGLAPMDGVTDASYRYIHLKYGNPPPDLVYTEFVPAEGIIRGIDKLFISLIWHNFGIPVIAQIFGNRPQAFFEATQIICELRFAGIDINMGCSARRIANKGGGASLISNPGLAKELMDSVRNGIIFWIENGFIPNGDFINTKLINKIKKFKQILVQNNVIFNTERKSPVISIKTRIGYDKPDVINWSKMLIEMNPSLISMHGRTLKQAYRGKADWNELAKASKIIHENSDIIFFANGDIIDPVSAKECLEITKSDGLLIGRATYGNPQIIGDIIQNLRKEKGNKQNKYTLKEIMLDHSKEHIRNKGEKSFYQMRKHLAWYISGIENAAALRSKLIRVNNIKELNKIIKTSEI